MRILFHNLPLIKLTGFGVEIYPYLIKLSFIGYIGERIPLFLYLCKCLVCTFVTLKFKYVNVIIRFNNDIALPFALCISV